MPVVTMPQTLYADLPDLQTRVRQEVLLECFDWNRDGVIDTVPVMEIVNAACTEIDMALQTTAGIYPTVFTAPFPPSLRDLALDGMEWRIGAKYPRFHDIDHVTLCTNTRKRLDQIRKGEFNLGQAPPEPSNIQGGATYPNPRAVNQPGSIFANDRRGNWGGVF